MPKVDAFMAEPPNYILGWKKWWREEGWHIYGTAGDSEPGGAE